MGWGNAPQGAFPSAYELHVQRGEKIAMVSVTGARPGDSEERRIALINILQIEFSPNLLPDREAILKRHGYQVMSILGSINARNLKIPDLTIGVVVIGHGATRSEREQLITYFRNALPGVPIVVLLRAGEDPFNGADFNCPADNPPLWERTVIEALGRRRAECSFRVT